MAGTASSWAWPQPTTPEIGPKPGDFFRDIGQQLGKHPSTAPIVGAAQKVVSTVQKAPEAWEKFRTTSALAPKITWLQQTMGDQSGFDPNTFGDPTKETTAEDLRTLDVVLSGMQSMHNAGKLPTSKIQQFVHGIQDLMDVSWLGLGRKTLIERAKMFIDDQGRFDENKFMSVQKLVVLGSQIYNNLIKTPKPEAWLALLAIGLPLAAFLKNLFFGGVQPGGQPPAYANYTLPQQQMIQPFQIQPQGFQPGVVPFYTGYGL